MPRSPFKKPEIEYIPQVAEATEPEKPVLGDSGYVINLNTVIDAVQSLQNEAKVAMTTIESNLDSFAITDRDGSLTNAAKNVLGSSERPASVSYNTYVALGAYPSGAPVRSAFQEKALSVWGNASIAIVPALTSIISECTNVLGFLKSGVEDESVIEQIGEWAGRGRMLVVDFSKTGTASSDIAVQEASIYSDQAAEVQKSALAASRSMRDAVLRDLSRLSRSVADTGAYETYFDEIPKIEPVGGSIVPILAEKQSRVAEKTRSARVSDILYRIEAFDEAATGLLASISELRAVQLLNTEIARSGGISEIAIEDIVTTKPDITFDAYAMAKVAEEQDLNDDDPASLQIFMKRMIDENKVTIPPEDLSWHTLQEHETLGLMAADDAAAAFASAGHDHDTSYSSVNHNHDSAYSASGHNHDATYVNESDHTKAAHDALGINADKLDGSHLSEIVAAVKLAIWPVGSIYTSTKSTSPATLFGGAWVAMPGRVLVGTGTITDARGETRTFTAGETGGEIRHVITESESDPHEHTVSGVIASLTGYGQTSPISGNAVSSTTTGTTNTVGGGQPHNNMQPFEVVYMWKRTA